MLRKKSTIVHFTLRTRKSLTPALPENYALNQEDAKISVGKAASDYSESNSAYIAETSLLNSSVPLVSVPQLEEFHLPAALSNPFAQLFRPSTSMLRFITTYFDFFHRHRGYTGWENQDILAERIGALSSAVKSRTYFGSKYLENMELCIDAILPRSSI